MANERSVQTRYLTNEVLRVVMSVENEIDKAFSLRSDGDRRLMTRAYTELIGEDSNGNDIQLAAEDDGTLRSQLIGHDGTVQRRVFVEDTGVAGGPGQLASSNFGWNGAALVRFLLETTGEQKYVPHGKDEASNIDAFRTDPNRIPWSRPYEGYEQVDPVEIPVAEGVLWNPGATAAELYEVSFLVINNDAGGAAVTVSVGVDLAAGGGLAAPEYWVFNEIVPYPGTLGWRGPFLMAGDDDIRGVASVANDASIHFKIRRVDTGA
jgi:hypothetical protein